MTIILYVKVANMIIVMWQ